MKILYPIGSLYPSQSGGPSNTVYWIAKTLAKAGRKAVVVTTIEGINACHSIESDRWIILDGIEVIYTNQKIHYLPWKALLKSFQVASEVDVIHLTAIFYPLSWAFALVNAVVWKKPVIWSPRGELDPEALFYSRWKKRPILWMVRRLLASRVLFHTTCAAETAYTKKIFGASVQTIQLPNYLELPERLEEMKELYFLYIGRIHPIKAIENLIAGLALSSSFRESNFQLKIAGNADSDYGRRLVSMVKQYELAERVLFLGHVEGREKQQLLARAYFSFMVSHAENFGNVVIEALAQGTPVVASKGTPWQQLAAHRAGFWIDNSPEEISSAVTHILSLTPEEYKGFSERALQLAREEYDIEKNIKHWVSVYEKAILDHTRLI